MLKERTLSSTMQSLLNVSRAGGLSNDAFFAARHLITRLERITPAIHMPNVTGNCLHGVDFEFLGNGNNIDFSIGADGELLSIDVSEGHGFRAVNVPCATEDDIVGIVTRYVALS